MDMPNGCVERSVWKTVCPSSVAFIQVFSGLAACNVERKPYLHKCSVLLGLNTGQGMNGQDDFGEQLKRLTGLSWMLRHLRKSFLSSKGTWDEEKLCYQPPCESWNCEAGNSLLTSIEKQWYFDVVSVILYRSRGIFF